ncbi:hypothetical protein VTO42DRAFT_3229 [Malbranchea cinnamomea]
MILHFLRLPSRHLLLAMPLGLGLSLPLLRSHPAEAIRCDTGPSPLLSSRSAQQSWSYQSSQSSTSQSASRGGLSASTVRQISLGSVLGLLAGLGLRIFSRPLAFMVGLAILVIEWAASKGYNIVPTQWLQRHMKSVDVRRAMTENIPFKASFGSTLILAAFMDFDSQAY